MIDRIAHASLGGEVDCAVEASGGKQGLGGGAIGEVDLTHAKAGIGQQGCAGALQGWIVIRVEVVDAGHVMAGPKQGDRRMVADEARGTGDKYLHVSCNPFPPAALRAAGLNDRPLRG